MTSAPAPARRESEAIRYTRLAPRYRSDLQMDSPSQDALLALFDRYCESLVTNFVAAGATASADAFHDARVAIKRMRAFFTLLEWLDPAFERRPHEKALRPVFKAMGRVRDVQIQKEIAARIAREASIDLGSYLDHLTMNEAAATIDFFPLVPSFDPATVEAIRESLRASLEKLQPDISMLLATAAFRDACFDICAWAGGDTRDLHALRTLSKRANYMLYMVRTAFPSFAPAAAIEEGIDRLQKLLGLWHDEEVTVGLARQWARRAPGSPVDPELVRFLNTIRREKARMRRRIRRIWRALFDELTVYTGLAMRVDSASKVESGA
jgi:CHAD domain-containing protein